MAARASCLDSHATSIADPFHAARADDRMLEQRKGNRQSADRTEVSLHPLVSLTVQLLVLKEFRLAEERCRKWCDCRIRRCG